MCSRKRLTFIKDCINNESVCHFMVVQLYLVLPINYSLLFSMLMDINSTVSD